MQKTKTRKQWIKSKDDGIIRYPNSIRRRGGRTVNKAKFIAFLLALLLLALSIGICGVYISYHQLTVKAYDYQSDKIQEPIKLVVMADLHNNVFGENNEELLTAIKEQEADAILMVGDFLNKYDVEHGQVIRLLQDLTELAPVYYSLGNHEWQYMENHGQQLMQDITDAGAELLELSYQDIELNGQRIRIGGMLDYAFALDGKDSTDPEKMDEEVYQYLCEFQDTELLKLMLSHRPESFVLGEASTTWDVDLVLSGHVHGGQVVLPFVGGLYATDQGFLPDYVYGLYEKDKIDILLTSGLGSGFTWVPRFNNPPEIVSLTLLPEK